MRRLLVPTILLWLAAAPADRATTFDYEFAMADGRRVSYELEVTAEHAGEIVVRAEWAGSRHVTLRLDPISGIGMRQRQTGASPLEIAVPVEGAANYKLKIFSLPASGGELARLSVTVPDEPAAVVEDAAEAEGNIFAQARARPDDPTRGGGRCGWRPAFERFVHGLESSQLDPASREALGELAMAIRDVEALSASDDPGIAGPVPDDPTRAEAWRRVRDYRLRDLENRLDRLHTVLGRDHAPALADEEWPLRLVACLTACERHFDERVFVGADAAVNAEIVAEEWPAIVGAAERLERIAGPYRNAVASFR